MARRRIYGEDLTYAEWHRRELPVFYNRLGHRLDMADRDWTEVCHFCRAPLAVAEEVLDFGQDLRDKAVTITTKLGRRARVPALIFAPRIERPMQVQNRIDELNAEIRALESQHPMLYITARRLWPSPTDFEKYTPREWAAEIYLLHRDHHSICARAQLQHPVVDTARMRAAQDASRIWVPTQLSLFDGGV